MSDIKVNSIRSLDGSNGPEISGTIEMNSTGAMSLPRGNTAYRGGRGRGIVLGGFSPSNVGMNNIDYVTIATTGNGTDFGDLSKTVHSMSACSSDIRGFRGGGATPVSQSDIDYINIASTGNAFAFGNLTMTLYQGSALSNKTRGIFYATAGTPSGVHYLEYINMSSNGENATNFGDIAVYPPNKPRQNMGTCASPTRGIFAGGGFPDVYNIIEYITINTLGNSQDFGDMTHAARSVQGVSSSTRGVFITSGPPSSITITNYITITSTGDAIEFGDCTTGGGQSAGMSNGTRGVFQGLTPGITMEYVTFTTLGDTTDFGDLSYDGNQSGEGCSDSHGGIG
tara:strand:- start:48 stop:1067 length:1020 start_codon:yes stop_codon:yes gene_type:complete